jgi:hypothetical protein
LIPQPTGCRTKAHSDAGNQRPKRSGIARSQRRRRVLDGPPPSLAAFAGRASLSQHAVQLNCRRRGHEALINVPFRPPPIARVQTPRVETPKRAVQLICRRRGHEALISPGRTSIAACNHFCERPQMASFLHHFRLHFSFNSRCCCQLRNFEDGFVLQKRPGAPPSRRHSLAGTLGARLETPARGSLGIGAGESSFSRLPVHPFSRLHVRNSCVFFFESPPRWLFIACVP